MLQPTNGGAGGTAWKDAWCSYLGVVNSHQAARPAYDCVVSALVARDSARAASPWGEHDKKGERAAVLHHFPHRQISQKFPTRRPRQLHKASTSGLEMPLVCSCGAALQGGASEPRVWRHSFKSSAAGPARARQLIFAVLKMRKCCQVQVGLG